MTTPCQLVLYTKNRGLAIRVADDIKKNSFRLEKKYNYYSEDSFVTKINKRKGNTIRIDSETRAVLSTVKKLSKKTNGNFDITVGTLKQCLKLNSIVAVEACRKKLKPHIGINSWDIEGDRLTIGNLHTQIDLGGVIKEYAVDQAGKIAKNAGISALINFGGDIYVNGSKPDGQSFGVAIKNPKNPEQKLAIIQLRDQGLATSAHYERSTKIEGKNYSHIIGESQGKLRILSATVISGSVLTSGIFSTSLMLDSSLQVSNKLGLILIDDQLRLHQNIISA